MADSVASHTAASSAIPLAARERADKRALVISPVKIVLAQVNAQIDAPSLLEAGRPKTHVLCRQRDRLVEQQEALLQAEFNADAPQFVALAHQMTAATEQLTQNNQAIDRIDLVISAATRVAFLADRLLSLCGDAQVEAGLGRVQPHRRKRTEEEKVAFREAAERWDRTMKEAGISEEDAIADFKKWRSEQAK